MSRGDPDDLAELLHRVSDFHSWVRTNRMFPTVPDALVHPLRDQLRLIENILVGGLYQWGEIERAAAIERTLERR